MSVVQGLFRRDRVFDFMVPKVVEDLDLSHGTVLYMEDVSVSFDGFKAINDSFGHDMGDTVLVETARRLRLCIRSGDVRPLFTTARLEPRPPRGPAAVKLNAQLFGLLVRRRPDRHSIAARGIRQALMGKNFKPPDRCMWDRRSRGCSRGC